MKRWETDNGDQLAIRIRDLSFAYDHEHQVLTEVDLDVWPLDSVCVVGPNGGGKTTLMKLIIGQLSPDCGAISIFGKKPEKNRQLIGYVPQYAVYDRQFPISVREVVCMGRLSRGLAGRYSRADWAQTMHALAEVGLTQAADQPFSALSGGQRQRVLIARALASGGRILILDEPTANIDQEAESHFFDLLQELNQRMTILMVTHDVGFAAKFFTRIACVNRRVVIHPTSEMTGELIEEIYGGDLRMIRHDHICSSEGHQHD
ncbi:MAG: metal ABC transporter ATP-binding protein [Desulfopila sp.]